MSSRQILVAALATFSLLAPRVARAADVKIAYVDLQRAIAEVDEGKAARARLEQMRDAKQKEIDKEQEVLKKEKDTYDKQAATMTEATRNAQAGELQKKFLDLQQRFEKGRAELSETERETFGGILAKVQPIIQTIAQRDGFTMVLEKTGILWAPPSLDVTNELIRLFNEKYKVTSTTTSTSKKSSTTPTAPATPT